jgi:hypothetical protein
MKEQTKIEGWLDEIDRFRKTVAEIKADKTLSDDRINVVISAEIAILELTILLGIHTLP